MIGVDGLSDEFCSVSSFGGRVFGAHKGSEEEMLTDLLWRRRYIVFGIYHLSKILQSSIVFSISDFFVHNNAHIVDY